MKITKKKAPTKNSINLHNNRRTVALVILLIGVLITLPFTIILLIGLLPTLTILFTDSKNTNKLVIIGCFNMAGIFVYLIHVLQRYSVGSAANIVSDIFNLIIMLGSAGIGLILYCELPNLFTFFAKISAKKRLIVIEERLKALVEEWGNDIIDTQNKK